MEELLPYVPAVAPLFGRSVAANARNVGTPAALVGEARNLLALCEFRDTSSVAVPVWGVVVVVNTPPEFVVKATEATPEGLTIRLAILLFSF
jgi:hypothetical protein